MCRMQLSIRTFSGHHGWVFGCAQSVFLCVNLFLVACGGGSPTSGGGGGGGGGGGSHAPTISVVKPSQAMTLAAASMTVRVDGTNFTPNSVVQINGTAVATFFQSSTELWVLSPYAALVVPGTNSVKVSDTSGQSNTASLTIYDPQEGPQPFVALSGYFTGYQGGIGPIAVADVNGDGRADVIVNTFPLVSSAIAVLPGQADGTLGPPQYIFGTAATALAVGDVDGNGSTDIIAGIFPALGSNGQTTSSFTVLLNDGTGNFTTGATKTFTGAYPGPMVLADVMGSGRNDLLVASHYPDLLFVFPNQGGGAFGAPVTLGPLGPDRWFTVADFNGDGKPDIAYSGLNSTNGNENTHLLLNQGGGNFNDVVPGALANIGGLVVAADFNNDGRTDLAIETDVPGAPIVLKAFLNMGGNSFVEASSTTLTFPGDIRFDLAVGDFDHDGNVDIAATNTGGVPEDITLFWGDGAGGFTPQNVIGPAGFDVVAGDINGDGIPDLVVPDISAAVTVVLGHAGRNYPQPLSLNPAMATSMKVGDVNGDGFPDFLFGGDTVHQIPGCVFLNDGHGGFTSAGRPSELGRMLVDFTRSGKADLLGFTPDGWMIWPGTGDPNYLSSPILISVPPLLYLNEGSLVADLNGDGLPELIGQRGIAWNKGNYQFDFVPLDMDGAFAVGDVNNDGRPDLITRNGTFLNQGTRKFTQIADDGLAFEPDDTVAIADFNKDGRLDIAYATPISSPIVIVAYGRGDGTFYTQGLLAVGAYGSGTGDVIGIVAGDFTGDGLADIVATTYGDTHVVLYTNDGKGEFKTSFFATGAGPESMVKADFNQDGKPDIAIFDPTISPPENAVVVFSH